MDREIRFLDQTDDRGKPALIGNSERGIDANSKLGQADSVAEVKVFEAAVVRNIEEDGFDPLCPGHSISWRFVPAKIFFARFFYFLYG